MSKFNNSYERLYEYWSYGGAIDYNVEKQLEDWITISREYTKLSKAFDKACAILEEGYGEEYASYEYFPDADTMEKIPMRMDACKWKEWLLND